MSTTMIPPVVDAPEPLDPAVDPRFRVRRLEVRRSARRRRRRIWIAVAVSVLVVLGAIGTLFSPLFEVSQIIVRGNEHLSDEMIRGRSSIATGAAMFSVDGGEAEHNIAQLPWVQSVRVDTRWPNRVEITVNERRPVAIITVADQHWVMAQGGVVVATATLADAALPMLTLPEGTKVVIGSTLADEIAEPAAMVGAIPTELRPMMTGATLSGTGEVDVQLKCGAVLNLGTPTLIAQKFLSAETVLGGDVDLSGLKRLDVRVPTDPRLERGGARCR